MILSLTSIAPTDAAPLALVSPGPLAWEALWRSRRGHLLQSLPWASLKCRFGWRAQHVAALGPAGLLGGAQMLLRARFGVSAAYVPRGPLWATDPAANDALLVGLARMARRARAVFVRLEPDLLEDDPAADTLHAALLLRGWRVATPFQPHSSIHLGLAAGPDTLFAAFSKGHRADIRRAQRQGLALREGGPGDVAAFFTMMRATTDRKTDYGIHSLEYYQAAYDLFAPRGECLLLLAELEGVPVATCMVFAAGGTGLYLYGGSNELGLKTGANHLLQQRAITWAQSRGCDCYDFWGIPDTLGRAALLPAGQDREALEAAAKDDPLFGVYRFKKGFGGRPVRYLPAYDLVFLPPLYHFWQQRLG